jgi:hypothetical protein
VPAHVSEIRESQRRLQLEEPHPAPSPNHFGQGGMNGVRRRGGAKRFACLGDKLAVKVDGRMLPHRRMICRVTTKVNASTGHQAEVLGDEACVLLDW